MHFKWCKYKFGKWCNIFSWVSRQLPPRKIASRKSPSRRTIAPWMIDPGIIDNCPPDSCPEWQVPPGKTAPLQENCSLNIKIPSTIITPTQANSPQWVLRVNGGKLCIDKEYYNIRVLQRRSKKSFTSICFLQVLTKPCRTRLIRVHLSLNASWFFSARTQKIQFVWKNWFGKKYKKTS